MDSNNNNEGSDDHLCVCTEEHALQPPESARGEIARALLYTNLRYYETLNLTLTDCSNPTTFNNNDNDNGNDNGNITNSMMGYFTRLIKWHLDDPPSSEEKFRNNEICQLYQGNRNPFIDFYEESWALLDFNSIDREVCEGAGSDKVRDTDDEAAENDDDYYDDDYYDDDYVKEEEDSSSSSLFSSSSLLSTDEPISATTTMFMGCHQFLTGDISFFMVQPAAGDSDLSSNEEDLKKNENEEWQRNSFGLVTLVDLEPGLVLYVAGVDVDDSGDAGILKVVVPDQGIKAGQHFGYGSQM